MKIGSSSGALPTYCRVRTNVCLEVQGGRKCSSLCRWICGM